MLIVVIFQSQFVVWNFHKKFNWRDIIEGYIYIYKNIGGGKSRENAFWVKSVEREKKGWTTYISGRSCKIRHYDWEIMKET